MATEALRVLIADDHPVYRHGLSALLDTIDDIEVVGEAAGGRAAVAAVAELLPQVVLMDLDMPDGGGIEATTEIVRRYPDVSVLILSMYRDNDLIFAALRAGARGYLLKEAPGTAIVRAVYAVARGEAVFGTRIAEQLAGLFAAPFAGLAPFPHLTGREREVLELLARGLDNNAIARRLTLAEKTVRNRVSDIFTKLKVSGRAEAVAVARDAGLGAGT